MPANNQLDTVWLNPPHLAYNRILNDLDETPRLLPGSQNTLCSFGGALESRGGTRTTGANGALTGLIYRMWAYETLEASPRTYLLATVYTGSVYTMYYNAVDAGAFSGWTQMTALGSIRSSSRPHEVVVARGIAYIKGYPTSGSDTLGLYQWKATGGTIDLTYWGLLGPTTPAALVGSARRLNGAIDESQTAITVSSTAIGATLPSTPFVVQCEFEQMNVTSVGGGTNWTVTRGYNGTTSAAHIDNSMLVYRNWSASTHNTQARIGWKYSYCWKNKAGHYSNRAPLQTNYDKMPSFSGPVTKLIPKFTVTAPSDTTNYPSVLILRSTDGGGTFYPLTEIDNTATSIDFEDKYFPTGTGLSADIVYDGPIYNRVISSGSFVDPVEDEYLIQDYQGPGLDTNSPLPTVVAPLITGTDYPSASSSLAYHMGRIWVAIGNVVFYTSKEELPYGIPEEASSTEGAAGNYFTFQDNVASLVTMGDRLYINTVTGRLLEIVGVSKDTFTVNAVVEGIGQPLGHPQSFRKAEDKLFLLSRDYHIYMLDTQSQRIVSHPLKDEIKDAVEAGREIQLSYYTSTENSINWLVVTALDRTTPTNSRQWVLDLYKTQRLTRNYSDNIERASMELGERTFDFWNSPWTIPAVAQVVGRWTRAENSQRLYWAVYNGSTSQIVYYDPTYQSDDQAGGTTVEYNWEARTNLMSTPSGNSVHRLRAPNVHPAGYQITIERLQNATDQDPDLAVYIDDLWQDAIPAKVVKDQFTRDSKGFRIVNGQVNREGRYFALRFRQDALSFPISIQKIGFTFQPNYSSN